MASALARRDGDGDGDGGAADGAGGRPGEPPVDAGGVERVRACRHRTPPLPCARGLEAHGARRGGGVGLAAAAGEGEAWDAVDVGGREPRVERRRRRVERRDAVAAAAVVAEGARGEDEDEEEQGGGRGEEDEDRERRRHHARLHGERQEPARAGALPVVARDGGGGAPAVLGFSSRRSRGWSGRGHLDCDEAAGVRPSLAWLGRSAVRGGMEYSAGIGGIGRGLWALALPNIELFGRVRYIGGLP